MKKLLFAMALIASKSITPSFLYAEENKQLILENNKISSDKAETLFSLPPAVSLYIDAVRNHMPWGDLYNKLLSAKGYAIAATVGCASAIAFNTGASYFSGQASNALNVCLASIGASIAGYGQSTIRQAGAEAVYKAKSKKNADLITEEIQRLLTTINSEKSALYQAKDAFKTLSINMDDNTKAKTVMLIDMAEKRISGLFELYNQLKGARSQSLRDAGLPEQP